MTSIRYTHLTIRAWLHKAIGFFNYSLEKYPEAKIFGITTGLAVMKINSDLGYNYKHPQYTAGTNQAQSFLAGSFQFLLSEIEVYKKE